MARKNRPTETVSTGSTADIAFLLLIFFLVTTTIVSDRGLALQLPPKVNEPVTSEQHERNLFKIVINGYDKLLVEEEPRNDLTGLQEEIISFVLNPKRDPYLSDSPQDAIVSLKTDRGTSYQQFIAACDAIKGAYYAMYSQRLNIPVAQVRDPASMPPSVRIQYEQLRREIPMRISLAEPSDAVLSSP